MKFILSSLMFAVFALFLIGSGESDTSDEDKKKINDAPGIPVTAANLKKALKANEIKFMDTYKGKVLKVSGSVEGVDTGLTEDDVIVKISAGGTFDYVRCAMQKSQKSAASNLTKGDRITIKGKCTGESIGNPQISGGLIVK